MLQESRQGALSHNDVTKDHGLACLLKVQGVQMMHLELIAQANNASFKYQLIAFLQASKDFLLLGKSS